MDILTAIKMICKVHQGCVSCRFKKYGVCIINTPEIWDIEDLYKKIYNIENNIDEDDGD